MEICLRLPLLGTSPVNNGFVMLFVEAIWTYNLRVQVKFDLLNRREFV